MCARIPRPLLHVAGVAGVRSVHDRTELELWRRCSRFPLQESNSGAQTICSRTPHQETKPTGSAPLPAVAQHTRPVSADAMVFCSIPPPRCMPAARSTAGEINRNRRTPTTRREGIVLQPFLDLGPPFGIVVMTSWPPGWAVDHLRPVGLRLCPTIAASFSRASQNTDGLAHAGLHVKRVVL